MRDETASFAKFEDPHVTANGVSRAKVRLSALRTLWFNTGTLCNIECESCYIESSPTNDRLAYLTARDVAAFLDEIDRDGAPVREIGFTGGEPFMNPDIVEMVGDALARGHSALVLTNAMRPMMRPRVQAGLLRLRESFADRLVLRVSLDHHDPERHDSERGKGSFAKSLEGMDWLRDSGFSMSVAARAKWSESEEDIRRGFGALFDRRGYAIDARSPESLVVFPEMDESADVPEITTECWGILGKSPESVMCSSSRMVVRRKGETRPAVVACTLLPYDPEFELGNTLAEASGEVSLNHPHCSKFCVLGGASCSPAD